MEQAKKEWVKPELLVLVRNNPEEAVLTACKQWPQRGPSANDWACDQAYPPSCPHSGCSAMSSS